MKLNRKLVLVLSLVLSVALATGGTLAYLSDTDADVNVMTLGNVYIVQNEQQRDADGNLEAFENNKPAYPAVGPIEWATKGVELNGVEYDVFTEDLKNVIDKFVTVTNTGNSDAYVRTIVAIEAPDFDPAGLIHMNHNGTGVKISGPFNFTTDEDVDYSAFAFTYTDVLKAGATSAPSLMQLFLNSKATNDDVAKFGDTWEVLVLSQAVQTAGFADAKIALDTAFGEVDVANVAEWFGGELEIGSPDGDLPGGWEDNNPPEFADVTVTTDAELLAAIQDAETDVICIDGDLTYDWGGDSYANSKALLLKGKTIQGKDVTDSITFKGYGSANDITDATFKNITIKDATVGDDESSWEHGYLEFNGLTARNVVFANSIMLKGDSTLTGCTVNNSVPSWYGVWVDSGNATFTGCEFTGTRAIKIHEAYGSEVKSVTVTDCTFTLSQKPGVVIGDLNADTTVTITGSTFDTEAGDQDMYIYESDTDVTTFGFSASGNTVK